MWINTYLQFTNRAEFLVACQTVEPTCPPRPDRQLPQGVADDIVGPLVTSGDATSLNRIHQLCSRELLPYVSR